jgi:hypothetical protein
VPLRFMGEEYGETAPFHFFTDHADPGLVRAVRDGRRQEIGHQSGVLAPDPQDPATLAACRLDRSQAGHGVHAEVLAWQQRLLALRRREPALGSLEPARSTCWAEPTTGAIALVRRADPALAGRPVLVAVLLRPEAADVEPPVPPASVLRPLAWRRVPADAALDVPLLVEAGHGAEAALGDAGVPGQVLLLHADRRGLTTDGGRFGPFDGRSSGDPPGAGS